MAVGHGNAPEGELFDPLIEVVPEDPTSQEESTAKEGMIAMDAMTANGHSQAAAPAA